MIIIIKMFTGFKIGLILQSNVVIKVINFFLLTEYSIKAMIK
jgi:hypothetical protein